MVEHIEPWSRGVVAELLEYSKPPSVILWTDETLDSVADLIEDLKALNKSERNYFLVDVVLTPAVIE